MKTLTRLLTFGLLLGTPVFTSGAQAQTTMATLTLVATFSDEEPQKEDESDVDSNESSSARLKINGRVILIGPDGKKKEFDINDPKTGTVLLEIAGEDDADENAEAKDANSKEVSPGSDDVELEERFVIGVQCEDASDVLRSHLGIGEIGVTINEVREETPAAEAGLLKHDIVLKIDGKDLASRDDLINAVLESEGQELDLAIIRAGKPQFISMTPVKMKVPVAVAPSTMDLNALSGLTGAGQQIRLRLSHPGVLLQEGMPQDQNEINRLVERIRSTAGDEVAKSMLEARDAMMQRQQHSEEQTKALNETLKGLQEQMKGLQEQMKSLQEQLPKQN